MNSFPINLLITAAAMLAIVIIVITLKRRAEKALANLRESEERYRLLVINSHEMIASHRPDGVYEFVSPTAKTLTGYASEELVGKSWYDFFHPDERSLLCERVNEVALQKKHSLTLDHQFCQKGGGYIWMETAVQPILDVNKKVVRLQNSSRDISERKRIEQVKDDFINTVSHELRTPLTIIKGSISNLKDGVVGPLTEKQAHVVETTSRNVDRLGKIVTNLLDLARLESGKGKINRKQISAATIILEAVGNFQEVARARSLLLQTDLSPTLPIFYADPDLIAQVLTNLLNNALRFAKQRVTVKAMATELSMQVGVLDDGPGIPELDQKLLFSKYEQLYRPTGGGYKGTGLGLAICKEIIDEHQGKIWVESAPGQGAKFFFSVPLDLRSRS